MRVRALSEVGKYPDGADPDGLYLHVLPTGTRTWRLRYWYRGREKQLSLGHFPTVGVKQARLKRNEHKKLLAEGVDPSVKRRADAAVHEIEMRKAIDARKAMRDARRVAKKAEGDTFGKLATDWFAHNERGWRSAKHRAQVWDSLESELASLWKRNVETIKPGDVRSLIRAIDARPAPEVARRTLQRAAAVFRWGVGEERCKQNPAAGFRPKDILPKREGGEKHYARVGVDELPALIRTVDAYRGWQTRIAIKLLMHLFCRPGELRRATWDEFDFESALWRIPAGKMKAGHEHVVPISKQAIGLFRELEAVNGGTSYVMPMESKLDRPASENVFAQAFKKMDYGARQTAHGFRAIAATQLREMGWPNEVVEVQLAHTISSKAQRAYDSAQYLEQRRAMMQQWSDFLDGLARPKLQAVAA